ncbi:MAG: ABC transporter permease [Sedimentisphaerales bacterium]|nr:ABC transporter permease [Sedimentisphaerales bacterium]
MRIKNELSSLMSKYSIFLVLLILFIICCILNENFLSAENLKNISTQISVGTILAFGETILIISGMLDLSSASVLALSGVVSVSLYKSTESLSLAFAAAVMVSVCCNLINGIMVTKFKTPSFIATLAMMAMARGAALMYTSGQNIYQIGNYTVLGQGRVLGIPAPVVFLSGIFIITWYLLKHTIFGRSIYAIGGNEEAANASGINVNKIKMQAFVINGIFVGIAGVLFMSRVNEGAPNGANGYEFKALTAAIIGGTSFSGGIGTASGTIAGAFIVGFLDNIMILTGVGSYLQQIIRGAIIALAVMYDINAKTRRMKRKFSSNNRVKDSKSEQSI